MASTRGNWFLRFLHRLATGFCPAGAPPGLPERFAQLRKAECPIPSSQLLLTAEVQIMIGDDNGPNECHNPAMKIFLTGGSGFVGSAAIHHLSNSHEILAMSRSDSSDSRIRMAGGMPVRCDLSSVQQEHLKGCDAVIHCAAYVGPHGSKRDFHMGNVEGTRRMLQAATEAKVERFIHIGTEAALFTGKDLQQIDESYPFPKKNPYLYGSTKLAAEQLVRQANGSGLETLVLRPRLIWGPGDTSVLPVVLGMVQKGQFKWIDGGRALTSTCFIENLTHAMERSLTRGIPGEAYFITDDEIWTIRDFLTELLSTQGQPMPDSSIPGWLARTAARLVEGTYRFLRIKAEPPLLRFPTDIMSRECTLRIHRARQELGYEPRVSVKEGLAIMQRERNPSAEIAAP